MKHDFYGSNNFSFEISFIGHPYGAVEDVLLVKKKITIENSNIACFCAGNRLFAISAGNKVMSVVEETKYLDTRISPSSIMSEVYNVTYEHGLVNTSQSSEAYMNLGVPYSANNLPLYDYEKMDYAAQEKKVKLGMEEAGSFNVKSWTIYDSFNTTTGYRVFLQSALVTNLSENFYFYGEITTAYSGIKLNMSKFNSVVKDYPEVIRPNTGGWELGYGWNAPAIICIALAYVNDIEKYKAPTSFDVYQNNNVSSIYWKNTEEFLRNGMVVDFRIARGYLSEKVEEFSQNWKNIGYSFDPVNVTWDVLKNVMGLGALFTSELYVYMRARNIAQDYETSWAYIAINAEGYVSAHGYVGDQKRIMLTVHGVGEEPPEGVTKDDEKGDNDEQKTSGETPKGHDPSNDSEIGLNVLTTSYILTTTQLNTLGNELWSDGFMQNIKMLNNSPIENVLSCKIFPTTFTGSTSPVKIGNVSMLSGETALKLAGTSIKKETGTVNIVKKFNSFLDFEPFTTAKIFLPFIGFQPITLADFYGATLGVRYVFDIVTGSCTAFILRNGNVHDKYSGQCAVDVPITASNRAQVEVGQVQSALTALASAATGNITGTLSAGLAIASVPNHFNTRGNGGGATSVYDPRQPFLVIDRPNAQTEISAYAATMGRVCNLSKTLNTLKGFTSVYDVHLDDVPCLESERQKLKSIMQRGFII